MPTETILLFEKTMERAFNQRGVPSLDYAVECAGAGDFCEMIAAGCSLCVCMGDAGGRDGDAAMLMASMHGWMRGRASSEEPASRTVRDLNRDVLTMSAGCFYPSLFHANIHADRGEVEYVNAGYHHVLLYRHRAQTAVILDRTGTVLGLSAKSRFEQRTIAVGGGDILAAITDGVGETLDERSLLEAVRRHSGEPSRELAGLLLRAADQNQSSVLVVRFLELRRKVLAHAA